MHSFYLDAIRKFEGFTPQATWDYAQLSNGYGTRARHVGEVIDRAEAERRFRAEVSEARAIVEKAAPHVDEGTKAALTSLTYNAGTAWIGSGLGDAVRRGNLDQAREIFQKYNKAGGEVLNGLVSRRSQEALWIGNPEAAALASAEGGAAALPPVVVAARDHGAERVAEMLHARPAQGQARSPMTSGNVTNADSLERGPRAERLAVGALAGLAGDALKALAEVDGLASLRAADMARLAQLGRGSELAGARSDRDQQDSKTRRT